MFRWGLVLLFLGIGCLAHAQFNNFPPGVFAGRAALDAGTGPAPVTFDTAGIVAISTAATAFNASQTLGISIGSCSNRAALLAVSFSNVATGTVSNPTGFTLDGKSLGSPLAGPVNNGGNSSDTWIWGLVNPSTGDNIAVLSWTGNNGGGVRVTVFSGCNADQTGGTTTFTGCGTNTGSGNPESITITATSSELAMAMFTSQGNSSGAGTPIDIGLNNAGAWNANAAAYGPGANPTISYTVGAGVWTAIGCAIKQL